MTRAPTAIDLFSGCGGLSLGLRNAGFNLLGAVEIDSKARATYALNHPEVTLIGTDIRKLTAAAVFRITGLKKGELDLLAGCPPCQGFSTLRHRNKGACVLDHRNDLIDEFSRLCISLRPKMVMMENVPGLASYEKFQQFVLTLKENNYSVVHRVVDVSNFGVPQRRKRLILVASRVGEARISDTYVERTTVRSAIAHLSVPNESTDDIHSFTSIKRSKRVQDLIEAIPKDGGSRNSLPQSLQLNCHIKQTGFNDVYGRMRWDDVAPTITSGCTNPSKGRFLHPDQNRPITLREAAILQGFPEDYKFDISHGKEAISLMIGNALPPPFIKSHSAFIFRELRVENYKRIS